MEQLLATGRADEIEVMVDDRDIVQLMYTSGTTAMPKGVLTSHVAVTITALSGALANKTDHTNVLIGRVATVSLRHVECGSGALDARRRYAGAVTKI